MHYEFNLVKHVNDDRPLVEIASRCGYVIPLVFRDAYAGKGRKAPQALLALCLIQGDHSPRRLRRQVTGLPAQLSRQMASP